MFSKNINKRIFNIALLFFGILGIVLFLMHILGFKPHDYFFEANPGIEKYIGTNVVSMAADLSFFTYHTLIFFCIWLILFAISELFPLKKLNIFLRKRSIVSFVTVNYIITAVLYTVFELSSGNITFGLYALIPAAIYNFVTNIIIHYVFFMLSLTVFFNVRTDNMEYTIRQKAICVGAPTVYLLIYLTAVKTAGMNCYKIIWYPYPIFDADALAKIIIPFSVSEKFKILLLIMVLILIFTAYLSLYIFLMHYKRKQNAHYKKQNNIDTAKKL